jgi:hypothetical protein
MADTDTIVVKVSIGLTEHDRRRIRTGYLGRGGIATRKEIRQWVNAILRAGIDGLPEPKMRRRDSAQRSVADIDQAGLVRQDRLAAATAAPDDALCGRCGKPKSDHGRMAFSCPPGSRARRKGGTFTPMEDHA